MRRALATRAVPNATTEVFGFNGNLYPTNAVGVNTRSQSEIGAATNYTRMFSDALASSGPVFACMLARRTLFSEARFVWQRMFRGRPGTIFGSAELALLESPWRNGTTGGLLSRMIDHQGLAGNAFVVKRTRFGGSQFLRVIRPDWVTIIMGSYDDPTVDATDLDAEVIGYAYTPGGPLSGNDPVPLLVEDVAHFAPDPDPLAFWRGMSWLTPVLREIQADQYATDHKARFFENGATPQIVVSFDAAIKEDQVRAFAMRMNDLTAGTANAYKTVYLGGGADVTVVGKDLQQLDFASTQGKGETRIAAASGIHPAVLGLSEGLQGASLNAGNFGAARRLTADKMLRPLWREGCGALATIIDTPTVRNPDQGQTPVRLWIDERDIPFLREDIKDLADAQLVRAQAIESHVRAGFTPDSAVAAVDGDDLTLLVHSGLLSVQLQTPGSGGGADANATDNGRDAASAADGQNGDENAPATAGGS
jgi:hypothetical protein